MPVELAALSIPVNTASAYSSGIPDFTLSAVNASDGANGAPIELTGKMTSRPSTLESTSSPPRKAYDANGPRGIQSSIAAIRREKPTIFFGFTSWVSFDEAINSAGGVSSNQTFARRWNDNWWKEYIKVTSKTASVVVKPIFISQKRKKPDPTLRFSRDLPCPVPWRKIFWFPSDPNQLLVRAIPAHERGVSRSSRTLGGDAVDADGAADEST